MKTRTKAYCAGLTDAEGCITVCRKRQYHSPESVGYGPLVTITNRSRRLMKWLIANFGGNFNKMVDSRYEPPRVCYRWWICNEKHIGRFLGLVSPFLVGKKSQSKALEVFLSLEGVCPEKREEAFMALKAEKRTPCVTTEMPDSLRKKVVLRAYLAGFVDGDGSIRIEEHRRKRSFSVIQPCISVGCTDRFVPMAMQKEYGGGLYELEPRKKGLKEVFYFSVSHRGNTERCLLHLLPYLIVQRERAKVVLDLCRLPSGHDRRREREALLSEYRRLKIQSKLTGDCERRPTGT